MSDGSQNDDTNNDLRKRVCLVKLYAWIKEQMEKSTAMYVADHLYQSEYLSQRKLENIQECVKRREAVEELLKNVLMGKQNIVDDFIQALCEEKHGNIIAIKLTAERATSTEIQKYEAFQNYSLGQGERPDSEGPRLSFTKNEKYVIMYHLKDESDIDFIINHLLSRFYVSIDEHNDVVRCSFSEKCRVKLLINTMMLCPETLHKYFYEVLKEMEISYVIEGLDTHKKTVSSRTGQKRKRPTTNANTQCMSDDEEEIFVKSIKMSSEDLDSYTNDEIGFGMEKVSKGSILIQMYPKGPNSWHKLEDKCRSGKIKDFIQVMFNKVAKHSLQEGVYNFRITIYNMSSTKDNQDNKMCLFHLETDRKSSKVGRTIPAENQILNQIKLLCEELEVNDELLTALQHEQLVQHNIKQDLEKLETRAAKIKHLLMKVASNGDKGYEVLKNYVMRNNEDLYRNMVASEGISVTNSILQERRVRRSRRHAYNKDNKDLFFTGIAVIIVKRSVETKNNNRRLCSLNISCPFILDPVIYVSGKD